jgi:hypothetical protein
MAEEWDYHLFGLRVRSEIPLPELRREPVADSADVTIALGPIPPEAENEGTVFSFDGAGRYWIADGNFILVEPAADSPSANVRLYLLGSAMGMLLHQRGMLPLHANAIRFGDRAAAFMGHSGAGKSTLAALFHDRGHEVIADDVCVVGFDEAGNPFATAGIPRLRLWQDSLAATGRTAAGFQLSYAGDEQFKKFDVPLSAESQTSQTPLAAIYLLEKSDTLSFNPLNGAEAVGALFANTYRGAFVRSAGDPREHWGSVVRLTQRVPIFRLGRPWNLESMGDDLDRIGDHALNVLPL